MLPRGWFVHRQSEIMVPLSTGFNLLMALTGFTFFILAWVLLAVGFVSQLFLLRYLRRSNKSRWEYLTTNLDWLGPGMWNAWRVFRYIFNGQDVDDQFVQERKFKLRKLFLFAGLCMASGVVTLIVTGICYRPN